MSPLADERTLEALDFASVRSRVVGQTRTQRGRAYAEALAPLDDFARVREEQARTAATRELVASADLHVFSAIDTAQLTHAAAMGRTLGSLDLRAVGEAIAAAAAAHLAVRGDQTLAPLLAGYTPLRPLAQALTDAIDERGNVLDRASPALGRIRRSLSQAQADARDRVSSILRSPRHASAIQDTVVTIREGRFVVPIKAEFSGEFPGIVHDTSSSGQTLFVEPLGALDANNRLRTLRIEEEREVARVLEELSRRVGAEAAQIEANVEMLAAIDLLVAKANVARAMDAVAPHLEDAAVVRVERGRHPLLSGRAVPQSLALDDRIRLLVISGPNMGGKTVALKMVGLFVTMAYCGMQLPADAGTTIGHFDYVVADIGDEQSIAANASTFSAHLSRMREMLDRAGPRTLAIVDEIGGGTEPTAGAALAVAILERLLDRGACAIVTTHSTELKLFAHAQCRVANASVRFDPETFAPTYALDLGTPGQSLAFPLARSLGIDPSIVARAEEQLESRERDYESALAELSLRNAELARMRESLDREREDARRAQAAIDAERAGFEGERRRFAAQAQARLQDALRGFIGELTRRASERESRRPRVSASQSALLDKTLADMRRDLGIAEQPADRGVEDASFHPDDRVFVRTLQQEASVVEDYGETILVAIGSMKSVVDKRDVERRGRRERGRAQSVAGSARLAAATASRAELDVRGKRFVEAEPVVDRWIDEALLAGSQSLRLIHGKGTGMLGRGLQEYLRAHPAVSSVRYGNADEGSGGVTIIELHGET